MYGLSQAYGLFHAHWLSLAYWPSHAHWLLLVHWLSHVYWLSMQADCLTHTGCLRKNWLSHANWPSHTLCTFQSEVIPHLAVRRVQADGLPAVPSLALDPRWWVRAATLALAAVLVCKRASALARQHKETHGILGLLEARLQVSCSR